MQIDFKQLDLWHWEKLQIVFDKMGVDLVTDPVYSVKQIESFYKENPKHEVWEAVRNSPYPCGLSIISEGEK